MSIILFLAILAVLIFVHELGHFLAAKRAGIRVDEFALGFPPKLFSWKRGETTYSLNLIPFGGFVKIFGEDPNEESLEGPDSKRSFVKARRLVQAFILSAGVLGNLIFAWLLLSIALVIGLPTPGNYAGGIPLQDSKISILQVLPGSPAEKATMLAGDSVLELRSGSDVLEKPRVESVQDFIASHDGEEVMILAERRGVSRSFSLIPQKGLVADRAVIGISLGEVGILKSSPAAALFDGLRLTLSSTVNIAVGLFDFIKTALLGAASLSQVTGPIGIATLFGQASSFGFAYLLGFIAFISINLAVINIFPFPALDGGRLLFVGIESVIRHKVSPVFQNAANFVGFALLIILMVVVTYNDLARIF